MARPVKGGVKLRHPGALSTSIYQRRLGWSLILISKTPRPALPRHSSCFCHAVPKWRRPCPHVAWSALQFQSRRTEPCQRGGTLVRGGKTTRSTATLGMRCGFREACIAAQSVLNGALTVAAVSWILLPCEHARFDNSGRRWTLCHTTERVYTYLKNAKATKNVIPIPGLQYGLATLHLHRARRPPTRRLA